MQSPNIGWLYYVDYFHGIDFRFLLKQYENEKEGAERLLKVKCEALSKLSFSQYTGFHNELEDTQHFSLTTTYPGLLVGAGYEHELNIKDEFKLGFFFDYTSGLPAIPGSSVKGVLRSAFKIKELMKELVPEWNEQQVEMYELEIFEGVDIPETNNTLADAYKQKKNWKYLLPSKKDVFYDAVITGSKNENHEFLAADFITPHKNMKSKDRTLDQFADPVPLQFMKVLPEVEFLFQFDVKTSKLGDLTGKVKVELFKKIIKYLGIGAKTRTGYGWMKE